MGLQDENRGSRYGGTDDGGAAGQGETRRRRKRHERGPACPTSALGTKPVTRVPMISKPYWPSSSRSRVLTSFWISSLAWAVPQKWGRAQSVVSERVRGGKSAAKNESSGGQWSAPRADLKRFVELQFGQLVPHNVVDEGPRVFVEGLRREQPGAQRSEKDQRRGRARH